MLKTNALVFREEPKGVSLGDIKKAPETISALRSEKNATLQFADSIAREIVSQNPDGPTVKTSQDGSSVRSIKTLDPKIIAGDLLTADMQKITEEILNQETPSPAIDPDGSLSSIKNYLSTRNKILSDGNAELKKISVKGGFDEATLARMNEINTVVLNKLVQVPVPKTVEIFQSEQIKILALQQSIYERILNKDSDPLGAAVAVSLITKVATQSDSLNQALSKYVEENKIFL
jgi:hypothetical protein